MIAGDWTGVWDSRLDNWATGLDDRPGPSTAYSLGGTLWMALVAPCKGCGLAGLCSITK